MNASTRQTSSLAVVSLVSGILGWTLVPLLGTLVAIVTGHMARKEIRNSGGNLDGDGLAVGGPLRAAGLGEPLVDELVRGRRLAEQHHRDAQPPQPADLRDQQRVLQVRDPNPVADGGLGMRQLYPQLLVDGFAVGDALQDGNDLVSDLLDPVQPLRVSGFGRCCHGVGHGQTSL